MMPVRPPCDQQSTMQCTDLKYLDTKSFDLQIRLQQIVFCVAELHHIDTASLPDVIFDAAPAPAMVLNMVMD
jgi:hypothetical protein